MDIGNNTGIDESHRQIFWGGGVQGGGHPQKDLHPSRIVCTPTKIFCTTPPPQKKRFQTGSLPEKATP